MKILLTINSKKQHGSVLILSLVILSVLTLIGVSSMSSSSLQEKMAGNFRDRELAFQAAEAALADGERFALNNINTPGAFSDDGTDGLYTTYNGPTSNNAFDYSTWWTATKSKIFTGTAIAEVRTQPRFIIEYRSEVGEEEGTSI